MNDKQVYDLNNIEDFCNSAYFTDIKSYENLDYADMKSKISKLSEAASNDGKDTFATMLKLLANICSLALDTNNFNKPYGPFFVRSDGARTYDMDDLKDEELVFLENIIDKIENLRLKARIADLLWILLKPRKVQYLGITLQSCMKIDFEFYEDMELKKIIERAIMLMLFTKKQTELKEINNKLFDHLMALEDNHFICYQTMSDLLELTKIPNSSELEQIATKLEYAAIKAKNENNFICAKHLYEKSIRWQKKLNASTEIQRITADLAEVLVLQGIDNDTKGFGSSVWFEQAIETYRSIPKGTRTEAIVQRINEIYSLLQNSQQQTLANLQTIRTGNIDISSYIQASIQNIKGKNIEDAVCMLANITDIEKYTVLEQSAQAQRKHSFLGNLFGKVYLTSDGRTSAKTKPIDFGDTVSEDYRRVLKNEMIQLFNMHLRVNVSAFIHPALNQILLEHYIEEKYIFEICLNSFVIPKNRALIWAKGLYFGFCHDYLTAIHLLIPQIEHLLRVELKSNGIKTTILKDGIEDEKSINELLKEQYILEKFGEDLIFTLEALLVSKAGLNLRNDIAHGLCDINVLNSEYALYLWWVCLRVAVNTSMVFRDKFQYENSE